MCLHMSADVVEPAVAYVLAAVVGVHEVLAGVGVPDVAGLPTAADLPTVPGVCTVAGVPAVADIPTTAGVPAIVGILSVVGISGVVGVLGLRISKVCWRYATLFIFLFIYFSLYNTLQIYHAIRLSEYRISNQRNGYTIGQWRLRF
jgi:hypothetical protein